MIVEQTKVVVVDMDGCLCSLNSFRYWLVFSFLYMLVTLKWLTLSKLSLAILLRVVGRSDRVQMKRNVLAVTEKLPEHFINLFCHFLLYFTNDDVLQEMRQYENSHVDIILSTAAPDLYVRKYSNFFNFSHVFATASVFEGDWKENIGSQKLESLLRHYGDNICMLCVITDHHDDLPLLLRSEKRILVKPTRNTLEAVGHYFEVDLILGS